jgi:hypothetical protein
MVEIRWVKRTDIHVCALVLLVTDLAIAANLTMDALLGGDPVGDRSMTGEAARGIDRVSIGVAFPAVRGALEIRVGSGQRTGSRLLSLGCLPTEGDDGHKERDAEEQERTGRLGSFVHLKGPSSDRVALYTIFPIKNIGIIYFSRKPLSSGPEDWRSLIFGRGGRTS